MKHIIYSIATVVTLIVAVMYIGSQVAEAYRLSEVEDLAKIKAKRKELNDYAKYYNSLTEHEQDSVKSLRKALR